MLNGAVPTFEITGGLPLAGIKGLFDAGLLSSFGALLFWVWVLPRARERTPPDVLAVLEQRLRALVQSSVAVALVTGVGWLAFQSGLMADATDGAGVLRAVPTVLASTAYGHLLLLQAVALVGTVVALGAGSGPERRTVACCLAFGALLLQVSHGHAMSMYGGPSLLLLSDAVHLFAGGAWLGGLLPLLLMVQLAPPRAGATAARSFSVLGKWCVGLMAATAAFQAWILVGSIPALVGTAYGWSACGKLLVFGILLGFACLNRYRLAPALLGTAPEPNRRRLVASIGVQSGFGLLVLLAAGVLSSLPPGMHAQPVWPFDWQLSLVTVREDPDFLREVELAAGALVGAIGLGLLALLLRRWRRLGVLLIAGGIAVLAVPHLDLLAVEANPTSFYRSPTGFAVASIVQGRDVYPSRCVACHGADGRGDGPLATHLPVPPADLTAAHLWMHTDGEMFWWLTHGIDSPVGDGLAMPGFASSLTPDDRWAVIDFIRARNAGLAMRSTGSWPTQVRAPAFQAECADGQTTTLADLRGHIVRLVIGDAAPFAQQGVVTVRATSDPAAHPTGTTCIATDETVLEAYAVVAGRDAGTLAGHQFLIDATGWLRTELDPGTRGGNDTIKLRNAIALIRQYPLQASDGMDHMKM